MTPKKRQQLAAQGYRLSEEFVNGNRKSAVEAITSAELTRVEALYLLAVFLAYVRVYDDGAPSVIGTILEGWDD